MSDPFGLRTNERALEEVFFRLQLRCGLTLKPSASCADLVKLTPILSLLDSNFDKTVFKGEDIQKEPFYDFLRSIIENRKPKGLRKSAIYLLGFIEAEPLLPVLESLLQDQDKDVVFETIRSIASIGSPTAFTILTDFFHREKNKHKRLEVLRNVHWFNFDQADLFVEEVLHSEDRHVLNAALEAAHSILCTRTSERLLKAVEKIIYQLLVDKRSVNTQRLALEILILGKPTNAVDYLITALDDLVGDPFAEEIVLALEEFDDQRILKFLESIVISPIYSEEVKQTAYSLINRQHER